MKNVFFSLKNVGDAVSDENRDTFNGGRPTPTPMPTPMPTKVDFGLSIGIWNESCSGFARFSGQTGSTGLASL